jgi:hypothetical protein
MDGKLSKAEAEGATLVTVPYGDGKLEVRLARRGAWFHAALTPIDAPVPFEMDFAWTTTPAGQDARSIFFGAEAGTFMYRISRDRKWVPMRRKKAAHAADPSGARGEVIEMIVPVGEPGVGLDADPFLKILIFARGEKAEGRTDWIPFPSSR